MWTEFTGPYGPGCGDEYVVHTPASMNGVVPLNAVKLVIQFPDDDDLVFLDAGVMRLHPPKPGDWEGKSHCSEKAASIVCR